MNKKIVVGSVVGILAALAAGGLGLAAYLYFNAYQNTLSQSISFPFNRTFLVEATDPQNRMLIIHVRSGVLGDVRMQVLVPQSTPIIRQDPVFAQGILTNFKETRPAQFSDLVPGVQGYMTMAPQFDTGSGINATYILIGGPVPAP
jgi:hypothetical protein